MDLWSSRETISKTRTGSNRDRRLQLESVACEAPGQQLTPSPSPAQSTTTQVNIGDTVDCLLPLIGRSACLAPWFSVVEESRRPSPRFANSFITSAPRISVPVLFVVSAAHVQGRYIWPRFPANMPRHCVVQSLRVESL